MWNQPIAITYESAVHITMASTLFFMRPDLKTALDEELKIGKGTKLFTWIFLVICFVGQISIYLLFFRMIKKKPSRFRHARFKGFSYLFKDLNLRKRWSFIYPTIDFSRRSLMCYVYIGLSSMSGQ